MTPELIPRFFTTSLLFGLVFTICVHIKPILAQEANEELNAIPEGDENHPDFPTSTSSESPTDSSTSFTDDTFPEINTKSSDSRELPSTSTSSPLNDNKDTFPEMNTESSDSTELPSTSTSSPLNDNKDTFPEMNTESSDSTELPSTSTSTSSPLNDNKDTFPEINTKSSDSGELPSTSTSTSSPLKTKKNRPSKHQDDIYFQVEIDEDNDKSFIGQVMTSIFRIPQVVWTTFTGLFN